MRQEKQCLAIKQTYKLSECGYRGISKMYSLCAQNELVTKWFDLNKLADLRVTKIEGGYVYLEHSGVSCELQTLYANGCEDLVSYCVHMKKKDMNETESCNNDEIKLYNMHFAYESFEPEAVYTLQSMAFVGDNKSEWSEKVDFVTPKFSECCTWKRSYPSGLLDIYLNRVCLAGYAYTLQSAPMNVIIPANKVTSWSIKILKSSFNNGGGIFIGVAPSDIVQNEHRKCGWYFHCYDSTLYSGPPHSYSYKEYGLKKKKGEYVHTGDSVGVVMDTAKGELSFVVNGVNFGIAYEGIPLDKPLVPCVLLTMFGDSVELILK